MRIPLIAALLLALAPFRPAAAAPAPVRVAVVALAATNVPSETAAVVSRAFEAALAKEPGLELITQSDVVSMLAFEKQKQLLGCEDGPSCLAEIGGSLGVRLLVSGSVARLGDELLVTVQLLDVEKARALRRASARVASSKELLEAVEKVAEELDPRGVRTREPIGLAVRLGAGGHVGILGIGVEYKPGRVGVALGTGRYALTGGVSLALQPGGGAYLDLHAVWLKGLVGAVGGHGAAFGATAGWDFRPRPWLSLKAGLGVAWNPANADAPTPRLVAFDLAAGPVF